MVNGFTTNQQHVKQLEPFSRREFVWSKLFLLITCITITTTIMSIDLHLHRSMPHVKESVTLLFICALNACTCVMSFEHPHLIQCVQCGPCSSASSSSSSSSFSLFSYFSYYLCILNFLPLSFLLVSLMLTCLMSFSSSSDLLCY